MSMDKHAADALVTGYEDPISGLGLPDPDDRHVLAAAIRCHADVIVTMNLRDFPLELAPGAVAAAAQDHRRSLKNRAKTVAEYLKTLERQGLTQTVSVLRDYML
jgi:hypothetical protein